jgi:glycosyltransferase involved in cell wall biosynthesis
MQSYRRSIDDALVDPEPNPGTDAKNRPLISIITPVYNPSIHVLKETIESVLSQKYENWQLCLINDCSNDPEVDACCRKYASQEPRITYVERKLNGGIAAASNSGLDVAEGEFVALLDHDDLLRPDALIEVVRAINKFPDLDMAYSDEDKLFADGTYDHSYAKSGWSPDLHLSYNYVCHFAVFRRTLLQQLNGWNLGFDGAQDYDLSLRFSEITDRIVHIPRNLYHWRVVPGSTAGGIGEKSDAWNAGKRALEAALARRSVDGNVNEGIDPGTYHVSYMTKNTQRVGIIIPTRDRHELISACVDGINNTTSWDNIETLVINNESTDKATLEWMDSHAGPVIDFPHQFSYARMMNLAAEQVDADLLLFLNCDITIIEPNWISAMVGHIQQRRVGAVGARLAFPDGQIQHEGIAVGVGGVAVNVNSRGYFSIGNLVRNCYALTGACLMVRPEVFWEAGGFEERLRVAFNDVDLTMRIHQLGYDLVYTPHASLLHQESALRGSLHPMEDENFFIERWGQPSTYDDPYYNPRLSRHAQYYFADDVKQVWLPRGHPLA